MNFKKICIIIPAYNEEFTVSKVISSVNKIDTHGLQKEIVVVIDGSTTTLKILFRKI